MFDDKKFMRFNFHNWREFEFENIFIHINNNKKTLKNKIKKTKQTKQQTHPHPERSQGHVILKVISQILWRRYKSHYVN